MHACRRHRGQRCGSERRHVQVGRRGSGARIGPRENEVRSIEGERGVSLAAHSVRDGGRSGQRRGRRFLVERTIDWPQLRLVLPDHRIHGRSCRGVNGHLGLVFASVAFKEMAGRPGLGTPVASETQTPITTRAPIAPLKKTTRYCPVPPTAAGAVCGTLLGLTTNRNAVLDWSVRGTQAPTIRVSVAPNRVSSQATKVLDPMPANVLLTCEPVGSP